jgi:hypothetical protein
METRYNRQRNCLRVDVQHGRQGERDGFARARLGYSYDVAAAQSHGPCLALNGRRLCKALLTDGVEEVVGEADLVKVGDRSWNVSALHLDKICEFQRRGS